MLRTLFRMETSLLPQQKVGSRSQVYSEGAKLVLISDQARDLVLKAGSSFCPFQKRWGTSGISNKSTV